MENQKPAQNDAYDLGALLLLLWKWRITFLIVAVAAAGISWGVTKFIAPRYETFSIVFPSLSVSREKSIDEMELGYDVHAERLIEILQSQSMMDSVVKRFDLIAHYDLDMSRPGWDDELNEIYYENVRFFKTKNKSVTIVVRDTDPQMAADIANYVANEINVVHHNMLGVHAEETIRDLHTRMTALNSGIEQLDDSIRAAQQLETQYQVSVYGAQVRYHEQNMKRIRDSLDYLRRTYKIYNYGAQFDQLSAKLTEARASYLEADGRLPILTAKGPMMDSIKTLAEAERNGARNRMEFFEAELEKLASINRVYKSLEDRLGSENHLWGIAREAANTVAALPEPDQQTFRVSAIESRYENQDNERTALERKYEKARNLLNPLPVAYLVSSARPVHKKVYPNTLLNVGLSTSLAVLFTAVILLMRQRIRYHLERERQAA